MNLNCWRCQHQTIHLGADIACFCSYVTSCAVKEKKILRQELAFNLHVYFQTSA